MKTYCRLNNGEVMPYTSIDDVKKKCLKGYAKGFDDIEIVNNRVLARMGIGYVGVGEIIDEEEL